MLITGHNYPHLRPRCSLQPCRAIKVDLLPKLSEETICDVDLGAVKHQIKRALASFVGLVDGRSELVIEADLKVADKTLLRDFI